MHGNFHNLQDYVILLITIFKALVFVFLALMLAPSLADAWPARMVAVIDGDTITVEPVAGGDRMRIRLHGIDVPEARQPCGGTAKGFVSALVLCRVVEIAETPQRSEIDTGKR